MEQSNLSLILSNYAYNFFALPLTRLTYLEPCNKIV